MNTRDWIDKNHSKLLYTTRKVVKNNNDYDDLYQSVVEQILKKTSQMDLMSDKDKLYYFIRVVKNNYFSKTSPYYYQHKKSVSNDIRIDVIKDIPDEPYVEELPDMSWVHKQLEDLDWFSRDLFLMWLELGTITAVSKQTTIPLNSVGRYIKNIKIELKQKWVSRN